MSRFLSESLQAPEPFFRLGLQKLESATGHANHDIRLSSEVMHKTRTKMLELGLDPQDTTPAELYHFLQEKVKADDTRLVKKLRSLAATHVSAEGQAVDGMIHAIQALPDSKHCFAIKNSRLKSLIKELPPKKAMKQLGYRSVESFLKHEPPVHILAAARLTENANWQSHFLENYKKLVAADFENRRIRLIKPRGRRWQELASQAVARSHHNILNMPEVGTLVFLPLPHDVPAGTVTTSLALALHDLNEIRAASIYLKICQVRPDFGRQVQSMAVNEPQLHAQALDIALPWQLIQRYYAQLQKIGRSLDELHLQDEEIAWHQIEHSLGKIEDSFKFWQDTPHLGLLHQKNAVSLNLLDVALNCCNQLRFDSRTTNHFKSALWHELLLRYLQPGTVEQALQQLLQPQLAEELVKV